jgi:hypothetical protein
MAAHTTFERKPTEWFFPCQEGKITGIHWKSLIQGNFAQFAPAYLACDRLSPPRPRKHLPKSHSSNLSSISYVRARLPSTRLFRSPVPIFHHPDSIGSPMRFGMHPLPSALLRPLILRLSMHSSLKSFTYAKIAPPPRVFAHLYLYIWFRSASTPAIRSPIFPSRIPRGRDSMDPLSPSVFVQVPPQYFF